MNRILPGVLLITLFSCNNAKKELVSMPGAYDMILQSVFDGEKDTTYTTLKEFKIFTDDHMMYANFNPDDSISRFGIGSYTSDSGKVTENVVFGASDTTYNDNLSTFTLDIEKTEKGYIQVIPEIKSGGKSYKLTEEYERVGTAVKSPLDGAWKQTKAYWIKGKDTTVEKVTQYKTFYAGHYVWGHITPDSTNTFRTRIGYGTFEMVNPTQVKENCTTSSYFEARGRTFDLDIEMMGADGYRQTITNTDSTKSVEEYIRMKK